MELYCYVPVETSTLELPKGCAILGGRQGSGLMLPVVIVAANGRLSRSNSYADLCRVAYQGFARRQTKMLPSVELQAVALWNEQRGSVRLLRGFTQLLERHLGRRIYRNELEASDSADSKRAEGRRDARRALMMGRPDQAMQIMAKHGLRGL